MSHDDKPQRTSEPLNVHSDEEACRNLAQRMIGWWEGPPKQLVAFLRLLVKTTKALPSTELAHTDHPLRHLDRTCPACIAESAPLRPSDGPGLLATKKDMHGVAPLSGETPRTDFDVFADNVRSDLAKGRLTIHEAAQKYYERARDVERELAAAKADLAKAIANHAADLSAPLSATEAFPAWVDSAANLAAVIANGATSPEPTQTEVKLAQALLHLRCQYVRSGK